MWGLVLIGSRIVRGIHVLPGWEQGRLRVVKGRWIMST